MSDLISDGMTKVAWVTSIANTHAPTAAELNAGNDWTQRVTPDGLKTDPTTADVNTSSLASQFDTNQPGRTSYVCEVTFKRGTLGAPDDQPKATLTKGAVGFLVVRRGAPYANPFATGDVVEIYPVACGEPANVAPTANEVMKFTSPMKVTSDPSTAASVA
jgi:hypothetical protein